MQTKPHRSTQRGITLIELLIVVVVIAILGTIALSSYRASVLRSNRAEATSALLRIQVAQEKYYLNENAYATTLAQLGMNDATERGLYTLALEDVDAAGFTATATAALGQVDDTECLEMSIDETGDREPSPVDTRCWR